MRELLDRLFKLLGAGRALLDVLGDEQRQDIIKFLSYEGELSVNDISQRVSISRPTVSHHLKLLLGVDLVTVRKEGVSRFYKINFEKMLPLLNQVVELLNEIKEKEKDYERDF